MSRTISAAAQKTSYRGVTLPSVVASVEGFMGVAGTSSSASSCNGILACELESPSGMMTAQCGTTQWMAPELCKVEQNIRQKLAESDTTSKQGMQAFYDFQAQNRDVEYGQAIDNYAFAVIMWEMAHHEPPWADMAQARVYAEVAAGRRPAIDRSALDDAPEGWGLLMASAWDDVPSARPTFSVIRKDLELMKAQVPPDRPTRKEAEPQHGLDTQCPAEAEGLDHLDLARPVRSSSVPGPGDPSERSWFSNVKTIVKGAFSRSRSTDHRGECNSFTSNDSSFCITAGNLEEPLLDIKQRGHSVF